MVGSVVVHYSFYKKVNHKAAWDIKVPDSWENTIGTEAPDKNETLRFCGMSLTSENLGNLTYGYLGYQQGIPLPHLIVGSYYAANFPTGGEALHNEIYIDWPYIQMGYQMAAKTMP